MAVNIKPAGLSTTALVANQLSLTVSYSERFRKPRCCKGGKPVQTAVTYSTGQAVLSGGSVFVPVIATLTAVYILRNGATSVKTFTEVFDLSFQGQTDVPASVSVEKSGTNSSTTTDCCGNTLLIVDDSIIVALA